MGDLGSIPGLERSPGGGKGYQLQYSGLENSMDYIVHGVEKSWTRLSDFQFTNCDEECCFSSMTHLSNSKFCSVCLHRNVYISTNFHIRRLCSRSLESEGDTFCSSLFSILEPQKASREPICTLYIADLLLLLFIWLR